MLHVCSLAALPDTVEATGASHVLTVMANVDQVQRPASVLEANHLKVSMDDITEHMDGFLAPSDAHIEKVLAFVRGWDPSFLKDVTLASINRPIRVGRTTVLPGDVILAKREGVVVIPAHLAETVVVTAEVVALKDEFGHARLRAGVYTPGQIDIPWTAPIKADFYKWLESRPEKPKVPNSEIEKHL